MVRNRTISITIDALRSSAHPTGSSRELIRLAEEFGWILASIKGDHHNFKHPQSRFIVTIVHPQKDVPVGRATDTVKKLKLEVK